MDLYNNIDFDTHEHVSHFFDRETGMRAIIAIHDSRLGPALGGCRMWAYSSESEALSDVLRLSRGMTFKAAMAGLPFGGGKAVIIGDAKKDKTPALLTAFARSVDQLGGRYYTGEDVGMSTDDMDIAGQTTSYVLGRSGNSSGDPSPWTAKGVLAGIKVATLQKLGRVSLKGLDIAVQGLGNVGMELARLLHGEGANLIVADINSARVAEARSEWNARVVPVDAINRAPCDILAPCALGSTINTDSVPELKCKIIAGSANNQLETPEIGDLLHKRGILFAPDYVINSGGLINIAHELLPGGYSAGKVTKAMDIIEQRLQQIFLRSKQRKKATHRIADYMAMNIVRRAATEPRKRAA